MDEIETAVSNGRTFSHDHKPIKKYEGKAWFTAMPDVNEPVECVMLLGKINDAISLFGELTDSHYTEWIFNASSVHEEWIKEFDEWISKTQDKLLKFRALLYGDNIDWYRLYDVMYKQVLEHEVYWHYFHEDGEQRAKNENEKLRKLLIKNGITKDEYGKEIKPY